MEEHSKPTIEKLLNLAKRTLVEDYANDNPELYTTGMILGTQLDETNWIGVRVIIGTQQHIADNL